MKVVRCLKIFAILLLCCTNSLYADGVLGSSSKASATITLTIPAYVFQDKAKSFDFNYDEPYQMTSFSNGQYKVIRLCNGKCSLEGTSNVIIFEPI